MRSVSLAFESFRTNPLRTALTILGLTMGSAALIGVMTIIQGANGFVADKIANLGSGSGFSVRQVLKAASAIVGDEIPHSYGPRRAGDPPALIASNDRAEELLGWRPKRGSLVEMIGSAWALLQKGAGD